MKAAKTLDPLAKQDIRYCVSPSIRDLNIRINNQKVKDRLVPHEGTRSEKIAIVGYGPSLTTTWKELKKFKYIISCSGATKFLLSKGLDPKNFQWWAHLDVDPRKHKKDLLGIHPKIEYLMASAVHPEVIEHLQENGCTVKLWHIFATDGESEQVLPREEWSITGGCDAGMRCATVARVLGFTDQHIFGMDGSAGETGNHAGSHPNQAKGLSDSEYGGKIYKTSPAWISCAQQWFKELDQLGDVTAKFYGEGLIQAMAKDYVKKPVKGSLLAFNKPSLISNEMRDLNAQLHKSNIHYGVGGGKYAEVCIEIVKKLSKEGEHPPTVLDYGCGKGFLAKELPFPIYEYDPAIPGKDELAKPADIVFCTDVLEHIEPEKIDIVLDDLKRVVKQVGYFVIHLGAAMKTLADGRNAHLIQETPEWWKKKLKKYFSIGQFVEKGNELHVVVAPWFDPDITKVGEAKFYTPNETTRWRAQTILKKEPITIEWINSMKEGETLYDIGANVGGYTVLAGLRGVNVYSFEPEAENFAILSRNLMLNKLPPNAYPLAVSDKSGFDALHLSQLGAGGSCHSFRDEVGFDGKERVSKFKQGCIGITLDAIKGQLPQPDHIKCDVDGLEGRVIKGAVDTLKGVKSLLIEVNPSLPGHLEMIDVLRVLGFTYDEQQASSARRKDGPFRGIGEIIFTRDNPVERHLIKAIERAEVIQKPFPHLILEDCFPDDYYNALTKDAEYVPIASVRPTKGYPQRFVGKKEFPELMTENVKRAFLSKFGLEDQGRPETLLIRDKKNYSIGPHTDSPSRILSAIFYLAKDKKHPELGTSLYVHRKGKTCEGGPHYPLSDEFERVKTVGYKPNTAFVFLKGDSSYHGVERTTHVRDVLLYDIRRV